MFRTLVRSPAFPPAVVDRMSVATGAVLEDSVLEQLPASQAVAADVATAAVDDSSSLTSSLDEFEGPEKVGACRALSLAVPAVHPGVASCRCVNC